MTLRVLCMLALAALALAQTNYGSYEALCDLAPQGSVTFVNYSERDCTGTLTKKTDALNACAPELVIASWMATCNSTMIQFMNYIGNSCKGPSVKTRTYLTNVCRNCNNPECKD